MPLPSRSTSAGLPVVLDTVLLPCSPLPLGAKEQNPIVFALMVALPVVMFQILLQRSPQRRFSKQDQPLDRHSSLTDLTQRSAYEFRFGFLAGNRSGFTLPVWISSRNDWQNFASRSCSR